MQNHLAFSGPNRILCTVLDFILRLLLRTIHKDPSTLLKKNSLYFSFGTFIGCRSYLRTDIPDQQLAARNVRRHVSSNVSLRPASVLALFIPWSSTGNGERQMLCKYLAY